MFVFNVWIDGDEHQHTEIAETHGKAKYQYYLYLQDGIWEAPFGEVIKHLRCKKIGVANAEALFTNKRDFNRMCESRGLSDFAYQGMKVEVAGKKGTIIGSNSSMNLSVLFNGEWVPANCHPWWETQYFDNKGNVLADYREKVTS